MSEDGLPTLSQVIRDLDLGAKKSLGQNFLLDLNLTRKIARTAGDLRECDVLEIGPGPGGLTRALLMEGARKVVAIERDSRCLPALQQISDAYPGRLEVLSGDALTLDPRAHFSGPVKIVANLPYNIGTELLVRWIATETWPPYWSTLTLMFQREVAERIVAKPQDKAYGRLAVLAALRLEGHIAFDVPARAFTPPPKVTSSIVQLKTLEKPRSAVNIRALERVTAKALVSVAMLRASLKGLLKEPVRDLEKLGIDPTRRAETLTLEEFCAISTAL